MSSIRLLTALWCWQQFFTKHLHQDNPLTRSPNSLWMGVSGLQLSNSLDLSKGKPAPPWGVPIWKALFPTYICVSTTSTGLLNNAAAPTCPASLHISSPIAERLSEGMRSESGSAWPWEASPKHKVNSKMKHPYPSHSRNQVWLRGDLPEYLARKWHSEGRWCKANKDGSRCFCDWRHVAVLRWPDIGPLAKVYKACAVCIPCASGVVLGSSGNCVA